MTRSNAILKRFRFHILLKTFTKFYYRYKDLVYNHNSTIKDLTLKRVFSIHDFDSKFIRENVYACAKLIVDEEEHDTLNRMVELNKTLTDSIRKPHKKDSALCKN